jgi:hypothetical protein
MKRRKMPDMNMCLVGSSEQGYPIKAECNIWHHPKFARAANRKFWKNTHKQGKYRVDPTSSDAALHTHKGTAFVRSLTKFINCEVIINSIIIVYLYIYIFNCNWVDTRWQQYSTQLHTNSTQNIQNRTYITIQRKKFGKCGPCPVFASYTLAFALQLRKKEGKPSVMVVGKCPCIPVAVVQYTFTHRQYTEQHNHVLTRLLCTYIGSLWLNTALYISIHV